METKIKSDFKAVEFMRQVRNDLSTLYQNDKQRYHDELKQSMNDFIKTRQIAQPHTRFAKGESKEKG